MRLALIYIVYIFAGFAMMFWFFIADVPEISSTAMATIWLYTLAWASNYTYVKWLGKLFRRQDEKKH